MNKVKRYILAMVVVTFLIVMSAYWFIPKPPLLDNFTFSSAIYDRNGKLLRLTLSRDEKYRLLIPFSTIPDTAKKALLLYEDKKFYSHIGVDPLAFARAFKSMITGARKQGGSTISMQLVRLIYDIDSTSLTGKIHQILRAIQLERHYTKDDILEAYFNLAPYGDNIEGIGAASLIYFQTDISRLSLPEILSLIIVPQNPTKRNPNRDLDELMHAQKRLSNLWQKTYPNEEQNAYLNLPLHISRRKDIPFLAPHFTTSLLKERTGSIHTTLDINLQKRLEAIVTQYVKGKKYLGIQNASVVVLDYETMEMMTYIGSADFNNRDILGQVDGLMARRSPGSTMKPFTYALALEQGLIHPLTLLKDLPKSYAFYNPENFDHGYRGIVSATSALVYSLNIPAVELLQKLKKKSYYTLLKKSGVRHLKSEEFYGLALALGGYEISMLEMSKMYAMLANNGVLKEIKSAQEKEANGVQMITPEACFLTLKMLEFNKPTDGNKKHPVYWKTGTSYSYKDAWSIGIAGKYVVGVWVGNFDGTPNHSFVGRTAAGPLFFEIIRSLEKQDDFSKHALIKTRLNLAQVDICRSTGDIANKHCPNIVKSWFIPGVSPIGLSNIHREIPIDKKTGLRACRHTPPLTELKVYEFWTTDVLTAFERAGISKKTPPEFMDECERTYQTRGMPPSIIYPVRDIVHIVRSYKLKKERLTLKAAADSDVKEIYWFINGALLGTTAPDETLSISAVIGDHVIKAVDNLGRSSIRKVKIQMED